MKKLIIIAGICSLSGLSMSANIGENYEAGGFKLGGSASVNAKDGSSSWNLNPNIDFFVFDGVTVGFGLDTTLAINSWGTSDSYVGLSTSLGYSFGYDSLAQTGLVYSVGGAGWLSSYNYNGTRGDLNVSISTFARADYFLTPRISVYGITSPLYIDLTVDEGQDAIYTNFNLRVGLSYSFAKKDQTWNNVSK
ncbi:MAG: hypothetical protein HRU38_18365 [Saccharospirillaceae bacterium]|nr:hypothetical protein [Pseudomonadales bacterium]NRB80602.1 hypothetical protein [Saccharospirillaceae bacterium]